MDLSKVIKIVKHEREGVPVVVSEHGRVLKGLKKRLKELEIWGKIETIQIIAKILKRILKTWDH